MLEWIGPTITAVVSAGRPLYFSAFIAASLLLFLPDPLISLVGLAEARSEHRTLAGATLLISASLLAADLLLLIGRAIRRRHRERLLDRNIRERLHELTFEEKQFLRPYIHEGVNSMYASYYDGLPNGLEAKSIIFRASNMSTPGVSMNFPWNLQPIARRLLTQNPHLLD
jgi:hypothetical protein